MTYVRKVKQVSTSDEVASFVEGNEDYKFVGVINIPSSISGVPKAFVVLEMETAQ